MHKISVMSMAALLGIALALSFFVFVSPINGAAGIQSPKSAVTTAPVTSPAVAPSNSTTTSQTTQSTQSTTTVTAGSLLTQPPPSSGSSGGDDGGFGSGDD